jgi:hypothetical protein
MLIFVFVVLGPGCGFMLYALYQFSSEARRFRHADPRRLPVTVVTATGTPNSSSTGTLDELTPHNAPETPEARAIPKSEATPAKFAAAVERPAQELVVSTYLENRIAAGSCGTGRAAMRHVTKGSF